MTNPIPPEMVARLTALRGKIERVAGGMYKDMARSEEWADLIADKEALTAAIAALTSPLDREAVARIIDDEGWVIEQPESGYARHCRKEALATADRIIALLPAHPVEPQPVQTGGVEAVRASAISLFRAYATGRHWKHSTGERDGLIEQDVQTFTEHLATATPTPSPASDGDLREALRAKAIEADAMREQSIKNARERNRLEKVLDRIASTPRDTFCGATDHSLWCQRTARAALSNKGNAAEGGAA